MQQNHTHKTLVILTISTLILLNIPSLQTSPVAETTTTPRPTNGDNTTTYWAVIICVGFNPHQYIYSKRDARDLKNILINHGWDETKIKVLLEEQATKQAILDTFIWLNQSDSDDVIFFYSGTHGYYMDDQYPYDEPDNRDEFIMPFDCDWETDDNCILDDELADAFDTLQSQNLAIVIESCHSGGMLDGTHDLKKPGRVIITGCDTTELGAPIMLRWHWLSCYYLIKALRGRADRNNDHWISLEEAYHYLRLPVIIRSTLFNLISYRYLLPQHPQFYDAWPTEENNQEDLKLIQLRS